MFHKTLPRTESKSKVRVPVGRTLFEIVPSLYSARIESTRCSVKTLSKITMKIDENLNNAGPKMQPNFSYFPAIQFQCEFNWICFFFGKFLIRFCLKIKLTLNKFNFYILQNKEDEFVSLRKLNAIKINQNLANVLAICRSLKSLWSIWNLTSNLSKFLPKN